MKNWMKRHKVLMAIIIVVVIAGVAAAIFVPRMVGEGKQTKKETRQNTVDLEKMDLTSSVSATGTIQSAATKTVSADISNVEVKSVKVSEGDEVTKGQTLVTFDQSDLQETLTEAKENLSDAESQADRELTSAKRKLSEAQETYSSQKEKLSSSVASAKETYTAAKKAVSAAKSQAEKEKAEEALRQAKSAYEQAKTEQENSNKQNKSNVQSAKDAVTTTQSNNKKSIREAQRSVDDAAKALEKCSVTAPMSGTVTAIGVEAGDSYNGGDMVEISDCTNLQVSTTVSEYDISKVKKGQRVVILTDATDDEEIEGKITYVAMTTSSSSLSSGNSTGNAGTSSSMGSGSTSSSSSGYEVRIKISSANEKLRVGMTAKCSIILEEANDVYAVPYDAIHTNTNGDTVIYVKDSTSGARKEIAVTKGMESDYYVEVSGDELTDGLQIIIPTDSIETSGSSSESSGSDLGGLMGGMGGNGKSGTRRNSGSGSAPGGAPGGGAPGM